MEKSGLPGATVRFHWGEWGVNALPFCKQRGRTFFCPALQTGLHKADMCMLDGFWPYNLQTCYYDYLPDDHDFFGFAAMFPRQQEDFLTGCTPLLRESDRTDVEKAARNASARIRHGLRGCFYAELATHEQKVGVLTLDEWDRILNDAASHTKAYEKIFASHDDIARYLKGKDGMWIKESNVEGKQIHCKLAGRTQTPLRLSVFRDEENQSHANTALLILSRGKPSSAETGRGLADPGMDGFFPPQVMISIARLNHFHDYWVLWNGMND